MLLLPSVALATTHNFAAAGNDANPCTSASPCQTITKAQTFLSSMLPGDQLLFNRGDTFTFTTGLTLPAHMNGTSGSRIVIGNYGSGALPVFDGGGVAFACVNARKTGSGGTPIFSYITIDGIE